MQHIKARTSLSHSAACHVFETAGCPASLLPNIHAVPPETALLAAAYKRLWDEDWSSNRWPGDFAIMQPARMFPGCKEFGLGQDEEALAGWLRYARERSHEMEALFCGWLAREITTGLPQIRRQVGQEPVRQQWRGGVAV